MNKTLRFSIAIYIIVSNVFTINAQTKSYENIDTISSDSNNEKPHIAFSFDDGSTKDRLTYKNSEWNSMIRNHLKDNHVQAVWFVAGKSVDSDKGKRLLEKWDEEGHVIANHTYNHFNCNASRTKFNMDASNANRRI